MTLLTLREIVVHRGDTLAVRSVSTRVEAKSWFGLIGANGSGKTSLLRAVAGRLPIASGSLEFRGQDLTADRAARARLIGFAPDPAMLPPILSPRDLLRIVAGDYKGALAGLGILRGVLAMDPIADRAVGTLSMGLRQRVAIACAFAAGQEVVILDEPFNWLDPLVAYDLRQALRQRVDEGLSLLTALHDVATLGSSCDQGAVLAEGAIALDLSREDIEAAARDPAAFERRTIEHLRAPRGSAPANRP